MIYLTFVILQGYIRTAIALHNSGPDGAAELDIVLVVYISIHARARRINVSAAFSTDA